MSLSAVSQQSEGQFSVSGSLDRDSVMICWPGKQQTLQSLQKSKSDLTLDLSAVEHVDTAGLAWIIHLTRECQAKQIKLSLLNTPEGLINLAKLSSVDEVLPLN